MIAHAAVVLLATFIGSMASVTPVVEEKTGFVGISTAPAPPPESAADRIALRQHRESSALNRFTFAGNVLEGTGDQVEHWIVMFCPGWHEKCQGLLPSYELLGVQWENKLNKDVMSSGVRFAKVDCATEKALCVSLDIDDYPSVVHYRNNQRVSSWHGGAPGLVRFVKQELEGSKRRPARSKVGKSPKVMATCDALEPAPTASAGPEQGSRRSSVVLQWLRLAASPWRSLCFAFMLLAATHRVWKLLTSMLAIARGREALKSSTGGSQQQHRGPASLSQSCLPQEWAYDRRSIDL